MKKESALTLVFGILTLALWLLHPNPDLKTKIIVTSLFAISVLLILFRESLAILRGYWQEIISLVLLVSVFILFKNIYPLLTVPALIILLTSIIIAFILSSKYVQNSIYYKKIIFFKEVAINSKWHLNHWKQNFASISEYNTMIFKGTSEPPVVDGSHIDLINSLEISNIYKVQCLAKADINTNGKFQLWCHDEQMGGESHGTNIYSPWKTPSTKGEIFSVIFKSDFNENIRIHLQYMPGQGRIEVRDVKIYKLKI